MEVGINRGLGLLIHRLFLFEYVGSVVVSNNRQSYYPCFTCDLEFLADIFGDQSFDTEDEAKQQVDDFLIRMSKLKAFI